MIAKIKQRAAVLFSPNIARLFLFLLVLFAGLAGLYLFGGASVSNTPESDSSMVKISAQPEENHLSQVDSVNEIKGVKINEDSGPAGSASSPKSVCLDPGHGGDDPGAMKGKVIERDINLIAAKKVGELLEAQDYAVFMTRTTNAEGLSKQDRYSFCNGNNASVLVAVHHNTYTSSKINYTTALYYSSHDQPLAESVARSVSAALKLENKGIAWFDNSVLSKSKMPAIFSEAFFMTNGTEYTKLADKDYSRLDKEAEGIVEGITNYFADPAKFTPSFTSEELKLDRSDW